MTGLSECFSTSTILADSEFLEASQDVAQHRYAPAKVEETETEQDSALLDTLKMVGDMVMVNMIITLATMGIVWYNL